MYFICANSLFEYFVMLCLFTIRAARCKRLMLFPSRHYTVQGTVSAGYLSFQTIPKTYTKRYPSNTPNDTFPFCQTSPLTTALPWLLLLALAGVGGQLCGCLCWCWYCGSKEETCCHCHSPCQGVLHPFSFPWSHSTIIEKPQADLYIFFRLPG